MTTPIVVLSFDVGIRNMAFAIIELHTTDSSTIHANIVQSTTVHALQAIDTLSHTNLDPTTKINANKIPLLTLTRGVLRALDTRVVPELNTKVPNYIIIENQPCYKNPRMKSIQLVIFSYFAQRYINRPNIDIRMFQPRDKFAVYNGETVTCALKSKYGRRKYLAVEYTRRMLVNNPKVRSIFIASKKKDDMADAYLQALTFIRQIYVKLKLRRQHKTRSASVTH